jgi:pilus assembly protein CpaB
MSLGRILLVFVAIASSGLAALIAKGWLAYTAEHNKTVVTLPSPVKVTTVVVAKQPLRYGMPLAAEALAEIEWPENAIPNGSFRKIADLFSGDNRQRVVLSALEVNEPLLSWKVSGPGQRASLSAMLRPELRAATIRVNDVNGVGGFVLPGDRVDVLLTREGGSPAGGGNGASASNDGVYTNLLLQDIHVLAVDQQVDDRDNKPTLAKTVTVEVDMIGAQKLALAASVGSLSLVLRQAGSGHMLAAAKIGVADLLGETPAPVPAAADKNLASPPANHDDEMVNEVLTAGHAGNRQVKISIVRALKSAEYDVESEDLAQPF